VKCWRTDDRRWTKRDDNSSPGLKASWAKKCAYMFNVYKNYKNQLIWQTESRNLTGPKSLPTMWHTYMKLVTKYQISGINSCWEKCDEKWAYMFNVYKNYKNQLSRQTGSRNLTGPKTLPTIWYTYMKLVTKNQISAIVYRIHFNTYTPEK
jgi:hypothetical protein